MKGYPILKMKKKFNNSNKNHKISSDNFLNLKVLKTFNRKNPKQKQILNKKGMSDWSFYLLPELFPSSIILLLNMPNREESNTAAVVKPASNPHHMPCTPNPA